MSRYGLAITLAWYQLRAKVTRLDHLCVTIDVMGLAEVRYGFGDLRWAIKRPTDDLVYLVCDMGQQVNGSFGFCSWNNGVGKYQSYYNLSPELRQMTWEEYEIWSTRVLGWTSNFCSYEPDWTSVYFSLVSATD